MVLAILIILAFESGSNWAFVIISNVVYHTENFSFPVIQIWSLPKQTLGDVIGISHKKGAENMTKYLWKIGKRNIGYIGGKIRDNDRTTDRLNGFISQMKKFGQKGP